MAQLEGTQEKTFRDKEDFDKHLEEDLKEMKMEEVKLRGYLNQLRVKLEDFEKNSRPFSKKEMTLLREIAQTKWAHMQQKVDNLAKEVFEEVMEHEMALAKLETFNFGDAIPKSATDSHKRSLLHRLNTLQASLKQK